MPVYINLNEYEGGINTIRNELGTATSLSNYPKLKKVRYNTDRSNPYEVVFSTTNNGQFPLRLIFRKSDLFLQGFVTRFNKYHYFDDCTITNIPGTTPVKFDFNTNYSGGLAGGAKDTLSISYQSLENAIMYLYNYQPKAGTSLDKTTVVLMILAVSEAARFNHVSGDIVKILDFVQEGTTWGVFHTDLVNWGDYSRKALANTADSYIAYRLALALS